MRPILLVARGTHSDLKAIDEGFFRTYFLAFFRPIIKRDGQQ